ncbi:HIT domain protein [Rickettsiales bacterium Ac37b]|nr:HIT domain protein [Rickettsiales bacterium Ac37b]
MEQSFNIDQQLAKDTFYITELELSIILLMNNALFPWIILIPKRNYVTELIDLSTTDQQLLMHEIIYTSKLLKHFFSPDKINVATLGNVVAQLHIHIIARFKNDAAWPKPVWNTYNEPYTTLTSTRLTEKIKQYINLHKIEYI